MNGYFDSEDYLPPSPTNPTPHPVDDTARRNPERPQEASIRALLLDVIKRARGQLLRSR